MNWITGTVVDELELNRCTVGCLPGDPASVEVG